MIQSDTFRDIFRVDASNRASFLVNAIWLTIRHANCSIETFPIGRKAICPHLKKHMPWKKTLSPPTSKNSKFSSLLPWWTFLTFFVGNSSSSEYCHLKFNHNDILAISSGKCVLSWILAQKFSSSTVTKVEKVRARVERVRRDVLALRMHFSRLNTYEIARRSYHRRPPMQQSSNVGYWYCFDCYVTHKSFRDGILSVEIFINPWRANSAFCMDKLVRMINSAE